MSPQAGWSLSRNQGATQNPASRAPHSPGGALFFWALPATVLLLACLLLASCGEPPSPHPIDATAILARACDFLWSRQSADGGWHSEEHGLMRGGEATTAFVLHALLLAESDCPTDPASRRNALDFIRSRINGDGVLGLSDPDIVDYPNYATAYALRILAGEDEPADSSRVAAMQDYLVSQQFDEDRGVPPSHPAFGGWGFGETILPAGSVGHVDLSHTRRVLEAVRAAGHDDPETYKKASAFLALHQKDGPGPGSNFDGGFFASAAVPVIDKSVLLADSAGTYFFSSYATATADGLLALLAVGANSDDRRVDAARAWLSRHPDLGYPAGIPRDHPSDWGRVMFFYHLMVRAEALRSLEDPSPWRDEATSLLIDRQQDDGRFSNPYGAPNKEDDPLIATAMAVTALARP